MFYNCTHMATVAVKGLTYISHRAPLLVIMKQPLARGGRWLIVWIYQVDTFVYYECCVCNVVFCFRSFAVL